MAVDGVPPRAKMNAERSSRFHKWKDEKAAEEVEEKLRAEFQICGRTLLPKVQPLDSNVITPGTKFMEELTQALHEYVCRVMKSKDEWSNIKVILSDSNVPGEGEHKIMAFIRSQRNAPGYDFNRKHCIAGMDADLILLALASHEVRFSILRVDVLFLEKNGNFNVHLKTLSVNDGINTAAIRDFSKVPFQFLHVWILREYLQHDLQINDAIHEVDFERVIDDFVFISFFLGNDFLPPLPNLDMHEKAMDLLMEIYRNKFNDMGGYLVDTSSVLDKNDCLRIDAVEIFLHSLGLYEERIFRKRFELKEHRLEKFKSNQLSLVRKSYYNLPRKLCTSEWSGCRLVSELNKTSFLPSECDLTVMASQNMMQLRRKKKEKSRELTDLWKHGPKVVDEVVCLNFVN